MSLMEVRSQWMRQARRLEAGAGEPMAIAATFTADPIVPYLGTAYAEATGATPRIALAPYNQIFQLGFDWRAVLGPEAPAAIVVLWRIEDVMRAEFQALVRGDVGAQGAAEARLAEFGDAIANLRKTYGGTIVVAVPPFPHSPDHHVRASRSTQEVGRFHRRLTDLWLERIAVIGNLAVLDLDAIQRFMGIEASQDQRKWYLYRQPFTEAFWNEAGRDLAAILVRQKVASKKCIVVDCDNTLWGGIVGEDGLEGIQIGEDFPGSAFRDFQHQLLHLRSQGVMVALCSKNNEADVWEVFDRHDGMVLKRSDVVAHRINWQDKPSNIAELAAELNIGLDSMVFVDDNPMEITHVREALPSVTCIQVPSEIAAFPSAIAGYRLFDRDQISDEDRVRSDMMVQERDRRDLAGSVDAETFRKSLELVIDLFEVGPEHVARVTQLANKTNQFNLTTRRKTAGDITRLAAGPDSKVLALRVADRFGDYGLVGVLIVEKAGETLDIESFFMSCRVLGRGVEQSIFAALADLARQMGATRLRGEYVPTKKNAMVADLYARYGFHEAGENVWETEDFSQFTWPEHVRRAGM